MNSSRAQNDGPKVYDIRITDSAYSDLNAIYAFIKTNSEADYYAKKRITAIEAKILGLSIFPNGYPKFDDELSVRVCHYDKYCIVFSVDDARSIINIVRIFHARQDYSALDL